MKKLTEQTVVKTVDRGSKMAGVVHMVGTVHTVGGSHGHSLVTVHTRQ